MVLWLIFERRLGKGTWAFLCKLLKKKKKYEEMAQCASVLDVLAGRPKFESQDPCK